MMTKENIIERFWEKVDKSGDCWEWKGCHHSGGYGHFYTGYRKTGGHMVYAHRLSWELANGKIPSGLSVLHHCDNPNCVNPDHLFMGSQKDNMLDRIAKDRGNVGFPGARDPMAKLTESQVSEIRYKYSIGNISQQKLAVEYGVRQGAIWKILHNQRWVI